MMSLKLTIAQYAEGFGNMRNKTQIDMYEKDDKKLGWSLPSCTFPNETLISITFLEHQ